LQLLFGWRQTIDQWQRCQGKMKALTLAVSLAFSRDTCASYALINCFATQIRSSGNAPYGLVIMLGKE
jgi:hypothetical protein